MHSSIVTYLVGAFSNTSTDHPLHRYSRQYSSIWAPQPAAYNMTLQNPNDFTEKNVGTSAGSAITDPIVEGDEASGYFSVATARGNQRINKATSIQKTSSRRSAGRAPVLPPMQEAGS